MTGRGPIGWANQQAAEREQASGRKLLDQMTDRELTDLYERIATLEHVAAGNKRHVQLIVPDLAAALARAEQAEAALVRARGFAAHLDKYADATASVADRALFRAIAADLRSALDPKEPRP